MVDSDDEVTAPLEAVPEDRRHRHLRPVALMTVIAVAFLAVGLLAGHFLRSPAQRQADTAPPPVTALTDTVANSVVAESVPLGASLERGTRTDVTLDGASGEDAERSVVSGVRVKEGQRVTGGAVLLEISGRPVILLPGAMPAYRTLNPGDSGPDVTQLQDALRSMKYLSGRENGFGPDTQDGVSRLYRRLGYTLTTVGADEVKEARAAVSSARDDVTSRTDEVETARIALARAQRPDSEPAASSSASSGPDTSRADGIADARRALRTAQRSLDQADQALTQASSALAAARSKAGVVLPRSEVTYVPSVPATVTALSTAIGKDATGTALTLVSGALVATSEALDPASATGIKAGQTAEIVTDDGTRHPAAVTSVTTSAASTDDQQGQAGSDKQVTVVVAPSSPVTGDEGTQVRVVVHTASSRTPVLNVPVSAVATGPQGDTVVTVVKNGTRRVVPVVTGLTGDGRVQITGDVAEGDTVLIGDAAQTSQSPSPR